MELIRYASAVADTIARIAACVEKGQDGVSRGPRIETKRGTNLLLATPNARLSQTPPRLRRARKLRPTNEGDTKTPGQVLSRAPAAVFRGRGLGGSGRAVVE